MEKKVCFSCGEEGRGVRALDEWPLLFARKVRQLARAQRVVSVCCSKCREICSEKRQKFEKMLFNYRLGGALFFVLLTVGSAVQGGFSASLLLPGAVGGAFISLLPYFYYWPKFES